MKKTPSLTELEGDVLGFIWKLGPATAYRVGKVFADSPSSHWRASAGAIYPVVERLLEHRLIRGEHKQRGTRSSALLTITPAGEAALSAWVAPDSVNDLAAFTHDPIRTRIHFLAILPRNKRKAHLQRVASALESQVSEYSDTSSGEWADGDSWDDAVRRGALEMHRARLRWVRWCLDHL